jgi:hypothetical protein
MPEAHGVPAAGDPVSAGVRGMAVVPGLGPPVTWRYPNGPLGGMVGPEGLGTDMPDRARH